MLKVFFFYSGFSGGTGGFGGSGALTGGFTLLLVGLGLVAVFGALFVPKKFAKSFLGAVVLFITGGFSFSTGLVETGDITGICPELGGFFC